MPEIACVRVLGEYILSARIDELISAELLRLLLLIRRRRESGDVTSQSVAVLERKMTKPTNPDYAQAGISADAVPP